MTGRDLCSELLYTGMEKGLRKLALREKMASAEDIAIMSTLEVCDLVVQKYCVVMSEDECVLLIPKDKMEEFNEMAVYLKR